MAKKKKLEIQEYRAGMIIRGYTDISNLDKVAESICSQHRGIKCLGNLVDKRDRHSAFFVRYKGKLWETMEWHATNVNGVMDVSIIFELFDGLIDDTEPMENYSYKLDYYKPGVSEKGGEAWYYKNHELSLAKEKQDELSPKFAFLEEVKKS